MRSHLVRAALAASLIVSVAACNKPPGESGTAAVPAVATTPEATIRRSAELLKQGDIAGVMQNSMPPADFEKAKADWTKQANEKPITDEDRQKFAETMGKLTAANAEQTLYAQIEPQLKQFDEKYKSQIPMYVAMGSSWLQGMIQQQAPDKNIVLNALKANRSDVTLKNSWAGSSTVDVVYGDKVTLDEVRAALQAKNIMVTNVTDLPGINEVRIELTAAGPADENKQQEIAAINGLANWITKTNFTDRESVKKALAIASKTARDINLKTLDEARALNFDQSMQKARIAFLGFKDALGVYGFAFDKTLDSVKPEVVSNDGKTAKIKVSYTLFDAPLSAETDMVNLDGRWYGKKAIEKLNEKSAEEAKVAAPAAAAPAAAPAAQH